MSRKPLSVYSDKSKDFLPGTHGCHEALHMVSFLADAVDHAVCEHPAITQNQNWYQLAVKAQQALSDLYQQIGKAHL